jgi:hypothetical protein
MSASIPFQRQYEEKKERSGGDAAGIEEGDLPGKFRCVDRELQGSACNLVCFRVLFVSVGRRVGVQKDRVSSCVCCAVMVFAYAC